jgi:hypothetical protein
VVGAYSVHYYYSNFSLTLIKHLSSACTADRTKIITSEDRRSDSIFNKKVKKQTF